MKLDHFAKLWTEWDFSLYMLTRNFFGMDMLKGKLLWPTSVSKERRS